MNIIPFDFEGQAVRVVHDEHGVAWFVAVDVCRCLDISNSRQALSRLDDDEKGVINNDTLGGRQEMAAVNEPGLYSLVLTSRKPEARRFKRWITHDVLPALRKTGQYQMPGHTAPPPERLRPPAWDAPLGSSAESLLAASRSFSAMLRTARHIGLSRQQQLTAANTITFRATGVDVLAEFDVDTTGRPMDSDACPPSWCVQFSHTPLPVFLPKMRLVLPLASPRRRGLLCLQKSCIWVLTYKQKCL